MDHFTRLSLPLLALLAGCGEPTLPVRSTPTPTEIGGALPADVVFDHVAALPAWWDPATGTVVRMHDGTVAPVQDRTFEAPTTLRVLDDDTIVIVRPQAEPFGAATMVVQPPDGPAFETPVEAYEMAFDGVDAAHVWYVEWRLGSDGGYVLCHALPEGPDCVTEVPNVGGYSPVLGVAADGSVYVTDRDRGLYRWDGAILRAMARADDPSGNDEVTAFRHGDGPGLLAIAYRGVYAVDGDRVWAVYGDWTTHAAGSPTRLVIGTYDSHSEKVDPSCDDGWFSSCDRRTVWSQVVFTELTTTGTREIGHDDCDYDHPGTTTGCEAFTETLAIDGDVLVLVGSPMRTLPL